MQGGTTVIYRSEPEASLLRRITACIVGMLPLESQL
jgi:hypothetical protein